MRTSGRSLIRNAAITVGAVAALALPTGAALAGNGATAPTEHAPFNLPASAFTDLLDRAVNLRADLTR